MSEGAKPSLRIDWFDGTLFEDASQNTSSTTALFADEDQPEQQLPPKPPFSEKKPIGFKRLLEFSTLKPPILTLEIAYRPGFWNLLDGELKDDFIVLIVKILAAIYKSLVPGEKSKITSMLKTRFEKSNFLDLLREYLIGLPNVRIAEKCMNMHLWNDVQLFYTEVYTMCEGIFNYGSNSTEYLKNIYDLLEILETSAIGVKEEHTETISDNFLEQIQELKFKIMKFINKVSLLLLLSIKYFMKHIFNIHYALVYKLVFINLKMISFSLSNLFLIIFNITCINKCTFFINCIFKYYYIPTYIEKSDALLLLTRIFIILFFMKILHEFVITMIQRLKLKDKTVLSYWNPSRVIIQQI